MEPRCEEASSNLTSTIKVPHVKTDHQILLTNCTISCVCAIWVSLFIKIKAWCNYIFWRCEENVHVQNTLLLMLECYGWMQGHWLLVCSWWLLGDCILLAQSKETNPSIYISTHPNNTFLTGLMTQSDWKGFKLRYHSCPQRKQSLTVSMSNSKSDDYITDLKTKGFLHTHESNIFMLLILLVKVVHE